MPFDTGFSLGDAALADATDKRLRALQIQQQQLLIQQQQQQLLAARQQLLLQQQMQSLGQHGLNRSRAHDPFRVHQTPQDMTLSIRSPLLEEFRNSKSKKYELKVNLRLIIIFLRVKFVVY